MESITVLVAIVGLNFNLAPDTSRPYPAHKVDALVFSLSQDVSEIKDELDRLTDRVDALEAKAESFKVDPETSEAIEIVQATVCGPDGRCRVVSQPVATKTISMKPIEQPAPQTQYSPVMRTAPVRYSMQSYRSRARRGLFGRWRRRARGCW